MDRLVGQRQHVEQRVEMADRGGNVDRFDRIAGDEMNRIETLPKPDEVLIVAPVAGPPPSRAVERIGGARHGAEGDVPTANREMTCGIARVQPERLRREADMRLNQGRVEANATRGRIDLGADGLQHCARLVVQEVDPDLFQHGERGLMDRFEFVARNKLDRRERRLLAGPGAEARRTLRPARPCAGGGARFRAAANPSSLPFPGFSSESADRNSPLGLVLAQSAHPRARQNGVWPCQFSAEALSAAYFAARSFGGSAGAACSFGPSAAGSGSGAGAGAPPENRAMSQERNNATASLLRSSGWVVR